jgi:uncharacterized repeat protein (TIGR01451 family)
MNLQSVFRPDRTGATASRSSDGGDSGAPGARHSDLAHTSTLRRPPHSVPRGVGRLVQRTAALALALLPAVSASGDAGQLTQSVSQLGLMRSALIAQAQAFRADVAVAITGPQVVGVNQPLSYRVTVTNLGPHLAANVRMTSHLPPELTYVSANTTQGHSSISIGIVRSELGSLVVGQTVVIDLIVIPRQTGPILNGVAIQHDTPDPNPSNNSDGHLVTVLPFPPPIPTGPQPTTPPCAADVSASVRLARGPLSYAPVTRRFLQQVILENQGDQPIQGPVTLLIEGLAPIVLTNASGFTGCWPPLNTPYLNVPIGPDNRLDPGEVATVTLVMAIPPNRGVIYRTRVLGGPGGR